MTANRLDEEEARDIAVRLVGEARADALLDEARQQVEAIVAEPDFRRDVQRLASELLRRRELTAHDITRILNPEAPHAA